MEQSVFYDFIAFSHLFGCERYLFQVVFTLVWVVVGAVHGVFDGVLHGLHGRNGVALFVGKLLESRSLRHNSLVHALPVVNVLAPSPKLLERGFSLAYGHGVVEIPRSLAVRHACLRPILRRIVAGAALLGKILLRLGFRLGVAFGLFLLLQRFYYAVDGSVPLGFRHLGKGLQ